MADMATATPATAPAPADMAKKMTKKAPGPKKAPAAKTPKVKPPKVMKKSTTHPKISIMVDDAIKGLGERGGSSFKAIKKYILSKYKVDVEKLAPFMRRYLKSGVKTGVLVQAKGKGANGSFKLAHKGVPAKKNSSTAPIKPKKNAALKKKAKMSPKPKVTGAKTKMPTTGGTTKKASPPKPKKITAVKKSTVKKITTAKAHAKATTKKPAPKKVSQKK